MVCLRGGAPLAVDGAARRELVGKVLEAGGGGGGGMARSTIARLGEVRRERQAKGKEGPDAE